jgi:hypothetical protein
VPWSSGVVRAAALLALEAVVLVALGVAYGVAGLTGRAESLAGVEVGAALIVVAGLLLLLVARGVLRRQRWARAPALAVQLLTGLTGLSLLQTLPGPAMAAMALAGLVIYQFATPEARLAFGMGRRDDAPPGS